MLDSPFLINTKISCLLYADDLLILSTSPHGLQNKINRPHKYCQKWNLNVNIKKTKVIIFNPRGNLIKQQKFLYDNTEIDIVPEYVYLGLKLHCSGNLTTAIKDLVMKGKKALFKMRSYYPISLQSKLKTSMKLFDSLILPVITYCCEIWSQNLSHSKTNLVENLHNSFCKQILGLSSKASNSATKAELGRFPIINPIHTRMLKYYAHLNNTSNLILKGALDWQRKLMPFITNKKQKKSLWLQHTKDILDNHGLSYLFANPNKIENNRSIIKERINDTFIQNWFTEIENDDLGNRNRTSGNKLRTYRTFKQIYRT